MICHLQKREDIFYSLNRSLLHQNLSVMYCFCNVMVVHTHTHTHTHTNKQTYVVHSISFQIFFVQVFKIVVYSQKISMLLLYILWVDWPIFMISCSNKLLQQRLEYTLLNPDCHGWWISKRKSWREEEWYAIKLCFKLGKNAIETYGMLQTAFRPSCMNRASVWHQYWHRRFKEGRESVRDDEWCGRSKEVNTAELIDQKVSFRVRVTMLWF